MGSVYLTLRQSVWRQRGRTGAALALLLAKLATVTVPLSLKAIVDRFSASGLDSARASAPDMTVVLTLPVFLLLAYALLRFAATLFTELRDLVFARVTLRTVSDFAQHVFAHLMQLSPRFHSQRSTGTLIRDVERGTLGIAFLLGAGLFTVLPTLVEFIAVLVVMIAAGYSGWFIVAIVVTFFVYAGYTQLMTRRRERRQRAVNEIDSRAQGMLVDSLLNVEAIKIHSREEFERGRFGALKQHWLGASLLNQHALSALHIGQSAIIAGGVAAVMLLAGQYTLERRMSVGDLVLVNAYLIQLCLPLNALGFVFRQTLDALVDTERMLQLLRQAPDIVDAPHARPLRLAGGEVHFEQVDFAYETGRPILHDFSLHMAPGQTVAVVGGSGSGKSTLARLLLRLYDPQSGRILLDGQDIRGVTLHDAIGVVSQDTALFNDTIAYNIAYGRPGAGTAEVIAAAQAAQVHELIASLPQQYETVVGERGTKLSGGEKQRIAIARALLKNPPLLIFDEATSALDTRAERAIQGELARIAQGRTTLIIAHRLSTIVDADRIVVMDKGRIVESGRHDALLAREGLYAQLWNLQRQQREFERLERRLARQPLNLAVLLAGTVDALRAPIEARRIALYTDIDASAASVSGDPGVLSQALYALGAQAVRVTPEGGRIEIALQRSDTQARLTVTDGRNAPVVPLPPRPRRRLLPEHDAEPDPAEPVDPLVLRSTIERQGGRFEVEMPAGTHGMRSTIELPLQAVAVPEPHAAAAQQAAHEAAPHDHVLHDLSVMCVDDNADALDSLVMVLRGEGAQPMPFRAGAPALQWLEQHEAPLWPRLLVCDITLADGEDGHQVVRRLRQLEAQRGVALDKRVPAIALTGHARAEDRLRALMAGFQLHLAKPVEPKELVTALAALAGRA